MLECVINISEGRDQARIDQIAGSAGSALLDVHTDPDHHRSVLTLALTLDEPGRPDPARAVAAEAVSVLDIGLHQGVHPRIGVVDVVPFVALAGSSTDDARAARDAFCTWAGAELGVPCFRYGPERTLPQVRAGAFGDLAPDCGPAAAHPTAGAMAVGVRPVLVAYNVWLDGADLATAQRIAREMRGPSVRALGLQVGSAVQVSMNLIDPATTGPGEATDMVGVHAAVARCELVGLIPRWVLDAEAPDRWDDLDLGIDRTIEARMERNGLLRP